MKDACNFFTENSEFIKTCITIILTWILNLLYSLFFTKREEKKEKMREEREERKRIYENRAELEIVRENNDVKPSIELFICKFDVRYNENKKYKIIYPNKIKNIENFRYKDIIVKNVGKSSITYLDIVSLNKKCITLCDFNDIDYLIKNSGDTVIYDYCYDQKIKVGECIKIRLYFLNDAIIDNVISANIAFLFEDYNHALWEQPCFLNNDRIYQPSKIEKYSDYRSKVTPADAYECFENPLMW